MRLIDRAASGTLAGFAATLPMTWTMMRLRRRSPTEWVRPLPPWKITMRVAGLLGLRGLLKHKGKKRLVGLSHYGFGAAAGAVYGMLPRRFPAPLFGLLVWVFGYLVAMPALSLYGSATKDTAARNRLMIASHLVWGAFLGLGLKAAQSVRTLLEARTARSEKPEPLFI